MIKNKACFVIAPIGVPGSAALRRSEMVFRLVIEPAVKKIGYSVVHARGLTQPGLITSEIIRHLAFDSLVIADLSGGNPNVFYELALRHAARKPVIQLATRDQQIPFDISGARTIRVDLDSEDSQKEAVREIIRQIQMIERDASPLESPLSAAGVADWTPFPDNETASPTGNSSIKRTDDIANLLHTLSAAEAIPLMLELIENLKKAPRVRLLESPIDDLDAACSLITRVPANGHISATSSLQGEDADERAGYQSMVNHALEEGITYRKIICSSPDLGSYQHRKWLAEFVDKAELISRGTIEPDAYQLLHYPSPMSVDVLISQDSDGECLEMVAGFSGGGGRGGFHSDEKRMIQEWQDIYLERKIIVAAERHTNEVLEGSETCSCLEFLTLLEDARQSARTANLARRHKSPKRKLKTTAK
jgi:hypothetical protein